MRPSFSFGLKPALSRKLNGGLIVSEENWHGIPRSKIPWYPSIDYDKCISCGKCVEYCKLGTYEFEEKDGKKRPW